MQQIVGGVTATTLSDEPYSPYVLQYDDNTDGLSLLAQLDVTQLDEMLYKSGAVLLRGAGLATAKNVQQFAQLVMSKVTKDNTEHRPVAKGSVVQTPVEYAKEELLLWHNENTFNQQFPSKAIFASEIVAQSGGQTPIVDSRVIFQTIADDIKQQFIDKQLMYVRKYEEHDMVGLGWKTLFGTTSKLMVEAKCRKMGFDFEWQADGVLVTRAIRPAVYAHPVTGEICWINQAQHWHFSCLAPATRELVTSIYQDPKQYPRNCYYGDGSVIADEVMQSILASYQQHQQQFDWQQGDLLYVDNVLKAHGRNPYQGDRKILVCFGDPLKF